MWNHVFLLQKIRYFVQNTSLIDWFTFRRSTIKFCKVMTPFDCINHNNVQSELIKVACSTFQHLFRFRSASHANFQQLNSMLTRCCTTNKCAKPVVFKLQQLTPQNVLNWFVLPWQYWCIVPSNEVILHANVFRILVSKNVQKCGKIE